MPHTIMAVDDTPSSLKIIEMILVRAGFSVMAATDGASALSMLEDQVPDLFLLDAMMPGIHGIELCKMLRSREDTRDIPIVMHTTQADAETIMHSLEAGANDFMLKPMRDQEFIQRIRKLIAGTEEAK